MRAIERLNASALVNSAPVQRVDRQLQAAFDVVGLSAPLARLSRRAHAIATPAAQAIAAQPVAGPVAAAQPAGPAQISAQSTSPIVTQAPPVQPFSFANQSGRFAASRFVASQSSSSVFQQPTLPPTPEPSVFQQTSLGGRVLRDETEKQAPPAPATASSMAPSVERHAISTVSRLGLVLAALLLLVSVSAMGLRATNDVTPVDQAMTQAEADRGHSLAVVNPANASGVSQGETNAAQNGADTTAPLAIAAQPPAGASDAAVVSANVPAMNSAVAANDANSTADRSAPAAGSAANVDGATLALPQAGADQAAPTSAEPEAALPQAEQGSSILSFLNIRSATDAQESDKASDPSQPVAGDATPEVTTQSPVGQALAILAPSPTPTRTPYPTFTSMPTATPTATATEFIPDEVPLLRIVGPSLLKPTDTPTPPPTATFTPTPTPLPISPGKLWSTFQPGPAAEVDHLWIERPFLPGAPNQLASPNYQFGSTAGNRYRIHHGIDISNPLGTPVIAGAAGEVIHAGLDDPALLGPYNNFYGNAVVIRLDRRLPVAGGELDVFLLYGHLNEVTVSQGQHVEVGDVVGKVGMTGIAIGPHLHVEMRLGANTYDNSVNPYLWLKPLDNGGAVAVRLLTADGRAWPGGRVSIVRYGNGGVSLWARHVETYLNDENLGPDPVWGENGAMGSVPPGSYLVIANVNGESLRTQINVEAGHTTFVELRTAQ